MKCELIKKISSETYVGKDGKTYNYKNYFLVFENGKAVPVTVSVGGSSDKAKAYKTKMFEILDLMSNSESK